MQSQVHSTSPKYRRHRQVRRSSRRAHSKHGLAGPLPFGEHRPLAGQLHALRKNGRWGGLLDGIEQIFRQADLRKQADLTTKRPQVPVYDVFHDIAPQEEDDDDAQRQEKGAAACRQEEGGGAAAAAEEDAPPAEHQAPGAELECSAKPRARITQPRSARTCDPQPLIAVSDVARRRLGTRASSALGALARTRTTMSTTASCGKTSSFAAPRVGRRRSPEPRRPWRSRHWARHAALVRARRLRCRGSTRARYERHRGRRARTSIPAPSIAKFGCAIPMATLSLSRAPTAKRGELYRRLRQPPGLATALVFGFGQLHEPGLCRRVEPAHRFWIWSTAIAVQPAVGCRKPRQTWRKTHEPAPVLISGPF